MTTDTHPGLATADLDGELAVFLIGMRVNRWRAVRQWLPVAAAMPRMLRELEEHPELGLLHAAFYRSGRTSLSVQYWRSAAHLERFARDPDRTHLPAWRAYYERSRGSTAVGIFHETYRVQVGSYEALYGGMPVHGLAAATRHVPVSHLGDTMRRRLTRGGDADRPIAN